MRSVGNAICAEYTRRNTAAFRPLGLRNDRIEASIVIVVVVVIPGVILNSPDNVLIHGITETYGKHYCAQRVKTNE